MARLGLHHRAASAAAAAALACVLASSPVARPRVLHAYAGTTPVLDGVLSPGEWDDAESWPGITDWMGEFLPLTDGVDLNATVWTKRDAHRLYFAFNITDDVLFRYDIPVWLPSGNPSADNLTQAGWPWFGDEVEVLLNPSNAWAALNQSVNGSGTSWQMVVNTGKSRLGGLGKGGLLEGEPRSSNAAWSTYNAWITRGAMSAAVGVYPSRVSPRGGTYVVEWGVDFNPCVELFPGVYYSPPEWDAPVPVGLNIAVGDVDEEGASGGNPFGLRHEQWFNGSRDARTDLWQFGTLWLEPGGRPLQGAGGRG